MVNKQYEVDHMASVSAIKNPADDRVFYYFKINDYLNVLMKLTRAQLSLASGIFVL